MLTCDTAEGLLSLLETGELEGARAAELREHLGACAGCRAVEAGYRALSAVCAAGDDEGGLDAGRAEEILDAVMAELDAPGADAAPAAPGEIMTLEEVAGFLRVGLGELERELDDLPTFEFAGRLRIRRAALLAWIEERERKCRSRRLLSVVERA